MVDVSEDLVAALRAFEAALLEDDGDLALEHVEDVAELVAITDSDDRALLGAAHAGRDRSDGDETDRRTFEELLVSGAERELGQSIALTAVFDLLVRSERPPDATIRERVDEAVEAVESTDQRFDAARVDASSRLSSVTTPPTVSLLSARVSGDVVVESPAEIDVTIRNVGDEALVKTLAWVEGRGESEIEAVDPVELGTVDGGEETSGTLSFTPTAAEELSVSVVVAAENAASDVETVDVTVIEQRERSDDRDGDEEEAIVLPPVPDVPDWALYASGGLGGAAVAYGAYRFVSGVRSPSPAGDESTGERSDADGESRANARNEDAGSTGIDEAEDVDGPEDAADSHAQHGTDEDGGDGGD